MPVMLSQCNGKKKALFIGINYFKSEAELRGCINDVANLKQFCIERFKFDPANMVVLTDDTTDPRFMPTKENIFKYFKWLVDGAQPGDSLFLHYSGHGGTSRDADGDEQDGFDETIIPVDFQKTGQIVDDEINKMLVKPLPQGVRLTAIFDSCHSGSVMDLPFTYTIDGSLVIHEIDNRKAAMKAGIEAGMAYLSGNKALAMTRGMDAIKHLIAKPSKPADSAAQKKSIEEKSSVADVIQFSGCMDEQTSADASIDGRATGAMSYAFIKAFKENPNLTYTDLLKTVRATMAGKFSQVPQLSAGRQMDLKTAFIM